MLGSRVGPEFGAEAGADAGPWVRLRLLIMTQHEDPGNGPTFEVTDDNAEALVRAITETPEPAPFNVAARELRRLAGRILMVPMSFVAAEASDLHDLNTGDTVPLDSFLIWTKGRFCRQVEEPVHSLGPALRTIIILSAIEN